MLLRLIHKCLFTHSCVLECVSLRQNNKQERSCRYVGRSHYLLFVYIVYRNRNYVPFAHCASGGALHWRRNESLAFSVRLAVFDTKVILAVRF